MYLVSGQECGSKEELLDETGKLILNSFSLAFLMLLIRKLLLHISPLKFDYHCL